MRWNDNLWKSFQSHKANAGEIPKETCPDIDEIIKMLEQLRSDNAKLRDLGKSWYEFAEEISGSADELRDKYDEMEKERDELKEQVEILENKLYQLA